MTALTRVKDTMCPYWPTRKIALRIAVALLVSITIVLAISTTLSVRESQMRYKTDMLDQAQNQLKVLVYAASVYVAQQDAHQLILIGQAAVEGGEPLFIGFYSVDGKLMAATAAPNAPDQARISFGDLIEITRASHTNQSRWTGGFLEVAQPIIYQGQASGIIALRFGTEDLALVFRRELTQSITTALLLVIVLNLVVWLLLRQLIIVPLSRLSQVSSQVESGVWVEPPGQERSDEFGELARSFSSMIHALRSRESELQEQVDQTRQLNADLDARVATRTEELARAKEVAEEANRMKTQFLANMSHELRTPLNAILNFTRFLSKERYGPLTARQQDLQQRVLANGEHLLGLINDILDLAKIESGRVELVREATDLRPILNGVMATAIGLTKDKHILLNLEVPDELPLVNIDKTRIRQVLLNLLSNAAKFTHHGVISLRVALQDEQTLCIIVQDTGIGIAREHQRQVFEEFRQVQSEDTREYGGTGLGLPISRQLVEMHGGQIWLDSTPGIGSAFSFTLPCVIIPSHVAAADR
jgi:signal transduction histidine kinase